EELARAKRSHVVAKACARRRDSALMRVKRAYRVIRGLNLNKQEHLTEEPVQLAHVPSAVTETMAVHLGVEVPADFAELREACANAMPLLHARGKRGSPAGSSRCCTMWCCPDPRPRIRMSGCPEVPARSVRCATRSARTGSNPLIGNQRVLLLRHTQQQFRAAIRRSPGRPPPSTSG